MCKRISAVKNPANIEILSDRICVSGPVTFATVPCLSKLAQRFAQHASLPTVIDLKQVSQADSSALALLLEWQAWAKHKQHHFTLVNVPASLLALGRVMGVDQLLNTEAAAARQE